MKVGCPDSCFQLIDILFLQQWLDPTKSIKKQCKSKMTNDKLIDRVLSFLVGPPYTFRFRVKFYTSDPQNLHDELTRYEREKARESLHNNLCFLPFVYIQIFVCITTERRYSHGKIRLSIWFRCRIGCIINAR